MQRYGGSVVERLRWGGRAKPSLSMVRNRLARGYPFDGFPTGGLLELIRDLIDHPTAAADGQASRTWLAGGGMIQRRRPRAQRRASRMV